MSQASSLRPHGADGHASRSLAKSSMSGAAAWRGKSAVSLPDLDAALAVALATLPSAPPLLLWPPQDRHTDTSSSKPLSATSQTRLLHFAASHGVMPCLDRHALHASLPEQLHNSMYGVHGKVLHPDQPGSNPAPDPAAAPKSLQGLLPQPPPQPRSCSQGGHRSPGSTALRLQGASKSASDHDLRPFTPPPPSPVTSTTLAPPPVVPALPPSPAAADPTLPTLHPTPPFPPLRDEPAPKPTLKPASAFIQRAARRSAPDAREVHAQLLSKHAGQARLERGQGQGQGSEWDSLVVGARLRSQHLVTFTAHTTQALLQPLTQLQAGGYSSMSSATHSLVRPPPPSLPALPPPPLSPAPAPAPTPSPQQSGPSPSSPPSPLLAPPHYPDAGDPPLAPALPSSPTLDPPAPGGTSTCPTAKDPSAGPPSGPGGTSLALHRTPPSLPASLSTLPTAPPAADCPTQGPAVAQGGAVELVGSPEGGGVKGLGGNAAGVAGEGGGQGEAEGSGQQGVQGGQGEDSAPHQRPRVGVRSVSFSAAAVTDSGGGGQERQGEVKAGSEAARDGEGEGAGEGAQLQLACQAEAAFADPAVDPSATAPVLLVVAADYEPLPIAGHDPSSSTSIKSSSSSSKTSASTNSSNRLDAEVPRKPGQTSSLPTITLHSVSSVRSERSEINGKGDAGASPCFSPCEAAERGFKERQLAAQQLLVSKNPAAFLEAVAAKEEAEHRLLLEKAAARWHKAETKAAQPQLVLQFRSSVRELQALRPYFICPQQRIRVHTLPALTGRVKDSRPGPLGSALSPSFFLQRKADSDGQDLYDTSRVRAQQFHMDWGRISAKAGWRSALHSCLAAHPGRGAAQGGAPEALVALQQECCRWSSKLRAVFTYYSCQGPGAGPQSVQSLTRSQWRAFFTDTQLLVLDVESEPTPAPAASEVALPPPTTPTPPPSTHPGKHGEGHGHQPQGSGVGSGHGLGGDSDKHLTLVDPQQASVTTGGSDPSSSKGLGPKGSSDSKPWGATLGTRSTLAAYGGREDPGREQVLAACRCSDEELEALFMQATEDDGEVHRASSVRLNRDCMLRFEFVSALLRCVVSKLVGAHMCFRASDALHLFMTQVLLPPLSASALQEPDVFREARLYRADVQAAIQHHWPLLQGMFHIHRGRESVGRMPLDQWVSLLRSCHLVGPHTGVGAVEAKLVFCWSQLQVPDEVRQRQRALTLGLWDFIEAVCRLADLLSPPSPEELDQALVMDLGCAPDNLPAPEAKLAHYYQLSKGTRRSLRSQPSTSQGVSSRPLSVKLHALAAVFCTYCMATWGGADEAECGARMSHMAAIIAA